tara:strand:+ start:252 stop:443 length:192 start_codon:yes stop_codon:yes gene_type:complete
MTSKGSSRPVSVGMSEEIERGLMAEEPAIDQINSASTTRESGQGPMLIVPDEDPPAEIAETGI